MYMHPKTYLFLLEQDREREMIQRALERAARSGGDQRPGLVRGGIAAFARTLRRIAGAAVDLPFGGSSTVVRPGGAQGA